MPCTSRSGRPADLAPVSAENGCPAVFDASGRVASAIGLVIVSRTLARRRGR